MGGESEALECERTVRSPGRPGNEGETKLKHNTLLVWKDGKVGDFELTFQYRIVGGNSGVQYRSKEQAPGENGPIVGGYQADFEAGKTYSGILYEERGRGILANRGQKTKIVTDADGKKHKVEVSGSVGDSNAIQAGIKNEDGTSTALWRRAITCSILSTASKPST
jgi:uncharacterized protein affecting Mg2+/Co2+ transport